MSRALDDGADPAYTHFAHRVDLLKLLAQFLDIDVAGAPTEREEEEDDKLVKALGAILDYYLPLPGLLDPSLDEIISPLLTLLSTQLAQLENDDGTVNPARLARVGRLLNWVVKVRGWKAVIPHFPCTISYLPMLITLLSPPATSTSPSPDQHPLIAWQDAWELRAVLLLWLALLLTVPFNLSALSDSPVPSTVDLPARDKLFAAPTSNLAQRVTLLTLPLLQQQGKEGAYAALVLARLFSRSDTVQGLPGFFHWATSEIAESEREGEGNLIANILEFLAMLPTMILPEHLEELQRFTEDLLLHLRGSKTAASSGLVRKLAVKARGRWWVARLGGANWTAGETPEGLEEELDDLMSGLGDKDTIVRYSSAKYLARVSSLLPSSLSHQIVLATIALFSGTDDEPVVETSFGAIADPGGSAAGGTMGFGGLESTRGEARWHGVCLALAEMARRGLVAGEAVGEAVRWVLKALTFDMRRASHSIGANVRDAASYLLWSLSRACPPEALAPYAEKMATGLVCVACFDREVGVRRAASAAFQEGVGRLGLYPEGIEVLGKTDFYSVSVRRTAFTVAAPAVAMRQVYRARMRDHLHHITLRHWDSSMRTLGAISLAKLLELEEAADVDDSTQREIAQLPSLDAVNVHGAIEALIQIAKLPTSDDSRQQQILSALSCVRLAALVSQLAAELIRSACELITTCLSSSTLRSAQSLLDKYFDLASRRREAECQEAAARVYRRLSELRDCASEAKKLIGDLKSIRAAQRQSAALALGHIQYAQCTMPVEKAISGLLDQLKPDSMADVETRQNAIRSLASIARQEGRRELLVKPPTLQAIVFAFTAALSDYSTDQRGDVGSWIRIAALNALERVLPETKRDAVPQTMLEEVVRGLVKQAVEKLEPVREAAALALAGLRWAGLTWDGVEALVFVPSEGAPFRYFDQQQWFLSAGPLLHTQYRSAVIVGLALSIGSQISPTASLAFAALMHHLDADFSKFGDILMDLLGLLNGNLNQNRVFIPTMITIAKLFGETDLLRLTPSMQQTSAQIVAVASRGIAQTKSIERISAAMKLATSSILLHSDASLEALPLFLAHRFPRIRAMTSEQLYLTLSTDDIEHELEEILLETSWTDKGVGAEEAAKVVTFLRR